MGFDRNEFGCFRTGSSCLADCRLLRELDEGVIPVNRLKNDFITGTDRSGFRKIHDSNVFPMVFFALSFSIISDCIRMIFISTFVNEHDKCLSFDLIY